MQKIECNLAKSKHPDSMTRGMDVGGSSPQLDQQHREILLAVASLLRAGRHEMALTILDNELGGGC
jgi:hypothetical protein